MNSMILEKQRQPHVHMRLWFYRVAVWIFSIALLLALLKNSNWQLNFMRLTQISSEVIVICAVAWMSSFAFRAFRFQSEWQHFYKVPFWNALNLTLLHNAAVVSVPFRAGELGYLVMVQKLIGASWQKCIHSLLWLRFQDAIVLICLAVLLLLPANTGVRLFSLLFLFSVFLLFKKWMVKSLKSRNFIFSQLRIFLHHRPNAPAWFWSLANWVTKILAVALLLSTLTGLNPEIALRGALAGELSALLPITGPAGLGTYEAGVWAGTSLPWPTMEGLMASVFITHLFFLFISLSAAMIALLFSSFNVPSNFPAHTR